MSDRNSGSGSRAETSNKPYMRNRISPEEVEKAVERVLPWIPRGGVVERYVRWAVTQTDAPVEYHAVMGVAALSALVNPKARVGFGVGSEPLNLYVMVVGDSGRERKSWSLGMMEKLLKEAAAERVAERFGSYAGLLKGLQEKPTQVIFEPEASRMLAGMHSKGGYLPDLKTGITDTYDGTELSKRLAGEIVTVKAGHRLTLVCAISMPYLQDFTEPSDFTGGFLSRWLFVLADRSRFVILPDYTEELLRARQRIVSDLRDVFKHSPPGTFHFDDEAEKLYEELVTDLDEVSKTVAFKERGLHERASALMRRVSALYAVDRIVTVEGHRNSENLSFGDFLREAGDSHAQRWLITADDLRRASEMVAQSLASSREVVALVEHSDVDKTKAKILKAIPYDYPVPLGKITKESSTLPKKATEYLTALEIEGRVESTYDSRGNKQYTRVDDRAVSSRKRPEWDPKNLKDVPKDEKNDANPWNFFNDKETPKPASPEAEPSKDLPSPMDPWDFLGLGPSASPDKNLNKEPRRQTTDAGILPEHIPNPEDYE